MSVNGVLFPPHSDLISRPQEELMEADLHAIVSFSGRESSNDI